MRAVIYARYSTEKQRAASIEDQLEMGRRYATQMGWTVIGTYEDPAISGGSRLRRGFQRLLADAEARRFDVVIAEAIDRLSRKLADTADLHDRLNFLQIKLHTVNLGEITPIHVGVMGMMAQMQLSDLADKTRRGLLGRTRAGKSAGGLAYGYDIVPPAPGSQEAGERRTNPDQAELVKRIFRDYAAGKAPRTIAADLNREGLPGPGGRPWGDTTIRGQMDRGTGILNNTLYTGQMSWNRCSYVKDPATGKRVARPNAADQHEVVPVPELRIIDDELWQKVKARQRAVRTEMGRDEHGNPLNRAHRRKFLLSGLLSCGCCGAPYAILAQDRYGCANRRSKATCDNARTINRQRIEGRVLKALQSRMLTPELVAHFIKTFEAEMTRHQQESGTTAARLNAQLASVKRRLQGVLRAIEDGIRNDSLRQRLDELETEQRLLQAQRASTATSHSTVRLHPNAAALYAAKVADLQAALNDAAIRAEAAESLGCLIEKVVLTPDDNAPDGLAAELHGDLAMILNLATSSAGEANTKNPRTCSVSEGLLSVVAGARFERAAFRL